MKTRARILVAVVGLVIVGLGIRQMISAFGGKTHPQELGERYTSDTHHCSLVVPKGWESKPSNQEGITFSAPKSSGYNANFILNGEAFAGSVTDYTDATVRDIKTSVTSAVLTSQTPFTAGDGLAGIRVAWTNKVNGVDLTQVMYFFDVSRGYKVLITCTVLATQAADITPLFDSSREDPDGGPVSGLLRPCDASRSVVDLSRPARPRCV